MSRTCVNLNVDMMIEADTDVVGDPRGDEDGDDDDTVVQHGDDSRKSLPVAMVVDCYGWLAWLKL